jgi:hypothetical protein
MLRIVLFKLSGDAGDATDGYPPKLEGIYAFQQLGNRKHQLEPL